MYFRLLRSIVILLAIYSILTIPIITSEVTVAEVKEAMETISNRKLEKWTKENLGDSVFAKRNEFYERLNNKKQCEEKS